MSEFWLIVTVCAAPTISGVPYGAHRPILSSECAEYRADGSFPSIEACRLHQTYLKDLPLERGMITASLCTAEVDRARLGNLPVLGAAALSDPA
jgi:hypothetical protein